MSDHTEPVEVVRSEEELRPEVVQHEVGRLHTRKLVDTEHVEAVVPRDVEDADVERQPAAETDSGEIETLPDGSVSIPLFEEQVVIQKRMVVRERVIIRKRRITEQHLVEADLRRERLEVEADESVADRLGDGALPKD